VELGARGGPHAPLFTALTNFACLKAHLNLRALLACCCACRAWICPRTRIGWLSTARSGERMRRSYCREGAQSVHTCTPVVVVHTHAHRGELSDVVVMNGRGFGFATFANPQNAIAFLDNKEHVIGERTLVHMPSLTPRSRFVSPLFSQACKQRHKHAQARKQLTFHRWTVTPSSCRNIHFNTHK